MAQIEPVKTRPRLESKLFRNKDRRRRPSELPCGWRQNFMEEQMPRLLVYTDRTTFFYAIDRAVGRNAPNDRLDVLLVQFMLSVLTSSAAVLPTELLHSAANPVLAPRTGTNILGRPIPQTQPGGTPIVIDGYCGPQTIGFIEFFQNDMRQRGAVIAVTGLVAPRGVQGENTLSVMNDMLRRSRLSWYLPDAAGFPRELKNYFYF